MTSKQKFEVGYGTAFSTRPTGMTTYLLVQRYADNNNVSDDTTCTWHIELCKQQDHNVTIASNDNTTHQIDISAAAGALVSVRNTGGFPFYAWVDY